MLMKRVIPFLIFLCISIYSYSQSQFGVNYGFKLQNLNTSDLNMNSFNGHFFGLSFLMFFSDNSDLITNLNYSTSTLNSSSYLVNGNEYEDITDKIKVETIDFEFLYNYYLIKPDINKFQFGILGGLGINFLNDFSYDPDWRIFDNVKGISPYYTIGISGGTEKIRLSLRYNKNFGNYLSGAYVSSNDFEGKLSSFSLNFTYYFTNSYN